MVSQTGIEKSLVYRPKSGSLEVEVSDLIMLAVPIMASPVEVVEAEEAECRRDR